MKTLASALQTHYGQGTTTLATALRIVRPDGQVYGFTSHDEDREIDGLTYSADPGLVASDIVIAANADVGNLELSTLHDGTVFTTGDVLGGRWRNSSFLIFRYDWSNAAALTLADVDKILAGTVGDVVIQKNMIVAELRDLRQYLQIPVGHVSMKTCPYRLGDERCKVPLSVFTFGGTITAVTTANRVFRDEDRTEAEDYFGEGEITFTSGDAQGLSAKIAAYAADGTFTLALPLFVNVDVGDTYIAVAGDRKRLEDCRDKFNNVLNFGGQPHRKGVNDLLKAPPADV